jgi:hypothetical protein
MARLAHSARWSRWLGRGDGDRARTSKAASAPQPLRLLVTGGVHLGAEQMLSCEQPGQWLIGSSLAGDLVLHDDGIAPLHVIVRTGPDGLEIEACAEHVALDAKPLLPGEKIHFTLDELDMRDQLLQVSVATAGLALALHDPLAAARPTAASASSRAHRTTRAIAPWVALAGVGAIAFGMLGWQQRSEPMPAPQSAQTSLDTVQRLIAQQPDWRDVRAALTASQRLELSGSVNKRSALNQLLGTPEVAAANPAVKVLVSEELQRRVVDFLADPGLKVSVTGAQVLLEGQPQRTGSRAALKLLMNELGERVEIVDRAVHEPVERARRTATVELPVRVASVNVNERYFETTTGARYFEGARLAQGHVVESINAQRIVFSIDGRRIEFRLPE